MTVNKVGYVMMKMGLFVGVSMIGGASLASAETSSKGVIMLNAANPIAQLLFKSLPVYAGKQTSRFGINVIHAAAIHLGSDTGYVVIACKKVTGNPYSRLPNPPEPILSFLGCTVNQQDEMPENMATAFVTNTIAHLASGGAVALNVCYPHSRRECIEGTTP